MDFHKAYKLGMRYLYGMRKALLDAECIAILSIKDLGDETIMDRDALTVDELKHCYLEDSLGGRNPPSEELIQGYISALEMLCSNGGPLVGKVAAMMLSLPLTRDWEEKDE